MKEYYQSKKYSMKDYNKIKSFDELIELEHGKIGSETRNIYDEKAQMFIVSEMVKVERKKSKNS